MAGASCLSFGLPSTPASGQGAGLMLTAYLGTTRVVVSF